MSGGESQMQSMVVYSSLDARLPSQPIKVFFFSTFPLLPMLDQLSFFES